jgi:hypothetical protein
MHSFLLAFILFSQPRPILILDTSIEEIHLGPCIVAVSQVTFQNHAVYGLTTHQLVNRHVSQTRRSEHLNLPLEGPSHPGPFAPKNLCESLGKLLQNGVTCVRGPELAYLYKEHALHAVNVSDWRDARGLNYRAFSQNHQIIEYYPLQFSAFPATERVVRVFDPNPIVTTGDNSLRDCNNTREAVPSNAYFEESLNLSVEDGLISSFARSTQLSAPDSPRISLNTSSFMFFRDEPQFEELNILYHIEKARLFLNKLGYSELQNRPVPFDAHALNGADQSIFSIFHDPMGSLEFGDGGVDDAEDADIIYHEYFHAIHFALTGESMFLEKINPDLPPYQQTNEPAAIAEAVADYFTYAMTTERNLESGFDPLLFGEWDSATDETVNTLLTVTRSANANLVYPEDMNGDYHHDSQVLTQALVEIRRDSTSAEVDEILMLTLALIPPRSLFRDFCRLFLELDMLIFGPERQDLLLAAFERRGIHPTERKTAAVSPMQKDDRVLLGLFNPYDAPATIELISFSASGTFLDSQEILIPARSAWHTSFDEWSQKEYLASVEINSAKPLFGWVQHISKDGSEHATNSLNDVSEGLTLPHIAENRDLWETRCQIVNTGPLPLTASLAGTDLVLPLNAKSSHCLTFTKDQIETPSGWAKWTGSLACGFEAFWKNNQSGTPASHQRAAMPLGNKLSRSWVVCHVAGDLALFWTGISVVNPNETTTVLTITAWDKNGSSLKNVLLELSGNGKWKGLISDLFPESLISSISHLTMDSDQKVLGFELFGTHNGNTLAGLPFLNTPRKDQWLPFIVEGEEGWTGIALYNPSDSMLTCTLTAHFSENRQKTDNDLSIPPHGKTLVLANDLWDCQPEWIRIQSTSEFIGFTVFGDHKRTWMDATALFSVP